MADQPRVHVARLGPQQYTLFYRPEDIGEAERLLDESMEKSLAERGIRRLAIYIYCGIRHSLPRGGGQPTEGMKILSAAVNGGMTYLDLWTVITTALRESNMLKVEEGGGSVPATPTDGSPRMGD